MRLIDADELLTHEVDIHVEEVGYRHHSIDPYWVHNAPTIDHVCGYPIKELIVFAEMCRRKGVTENELHDWITNMEYGYRFIMEMIKKEQGYQLEVFLNGVLDKK